MTLCTKKILGLARSTDKGASTYKCTVCGELHLKSDDEKFRQKKLLSVFSILVLAVISGFGINHILNETKSNESISLSSEGNITREIKKRKKNPDGDNIGNSANNEQQSEMEILKSKTALDTNALAINSKGKSRNLKPLKRITLKKQSLPEFHIVKQGETIYTISRKYDVNVVDLRNLNNLSDNRLKTGQKVYLLKGAKEKALKNEFSKEETLKTGTPKTKKTHSVPEPKVNEKQTIFSKKNIIKCVKTINEIKDEYPYDWRDKTDCAEGKSENKNKIEVMKSDKKYLRRNGDRRINFCGCM